MQVLIPAEYRQSVRWVLNLDAGSFALAAGGAILGFEVLRGHGLLLVRIPEALGIMAVAAVLAFVRWPLDHGDRMLTWGRRAWNYYWRSRKGSAWGE